MYRLIAVPLEDAKFSWNYKQLSVSFLIVAKWLISKFYW